MKWLQEIRATRRSLAEIGLLVVVREVFRNRFEMTMTEADETLGAGWAAHAKALAKAGMLRLEHNGLWLLMSVVAPGDGKPPEHSSLVLNTSVNRTGLGMFI